MAKKENNFAWLKFRPLDWMDVLLMDDAQAGARFKELILRTGKGEAPEGTIEARMIAEYNDYSRVKREAVAARWQKAKEAARPAPPEPPRNAPRPKRPPTLPEVYDFCQQYNLPDTYGREWLEWQEQKGWNTLRVHWHAGLTAFCKKKLKDEKH